MTPITHHWFRFWFATCYLLGDYGQFIPKTNRTQDNSHLRRLVPKTTCTNRHVRGTCRVVKYILVWEMSVGLQLRTLGLRGVNAVFFHDVLPRSGGLELSRPGSTSWRAAHDSFVRVVPFLSAFTACCTRLLGTSCLDSVHIGPIAIWPIAITALCCRTY